MRLLRNFSLFLVLSTLTTPLLAQTNRIDFAQAFPGTDGNDVGPSEIAVDSSDGGRYDQIRTEKIDLWFRLSLNKLTNIEPTIPFEQQHAYNVISRVEILTEGVTIQATGANYSAKRYKLSFPYAHPHSGSIANQRNSPIETCNQRLDSLAGAAREEFRNKGARIELGSAYPARARGFIEFRRTAGPKAGEMAVVRTHDDNIRAKVTVVCRALNVPKARTETHTRGVDPRPGQRLEPTISGAGLRMEPAAIQTVNGQLCPTQLKLYGQVQAIRKFEGKAVIFGPGYFSPVTQLNYTHGGNRNIVATYPLSWDNPGGLAAAGAQAPRSQSVSLTMNVTTMDNKVLKQAQETVTVTCKLIAQAALLNLPAEPNKPASPARLATPIALPPQPLGFLWDRPAAAAPAAASFAGALHSGAGGARLLPGIDLAIRRVDRGGSGGATRLFLRNGGDTAAQGCRVVARKGGHDKWILIESMSSPLMPGATPPAGKQKAWLTSNFRFEAPAGATTELMADLPRDPNLEFAVDCPGEPSDRLGNNLATLP
jgi:hypothetical protein